MKIENPKYNHTTHEPNLINKIFKKTATDISNIINKISDEIILLPYIKGNAEYCQFCGEITTEKERMVNHLDCS